jgi:DNA polymerase
MTRRFLLDVESTSPLDLKKVGAAKYWAHPETRIICVCYAADDGPVVKWRPGDPVPYFVPELNDYGCGWRVVAHNYLFELNAWKFQLGPKYGWGQLALSTWDCTMARALYWGLPAGLKDVCDAMQLPVQIDSAKKSRILRTARPRSGTGTAADPYVWWHETDPDKLNEVIEDCVRDVEAERALDDKLPELPDRERAVFLIDGAINQRGILVDLGMVDKLEALTKAEGARLNADMARLTNNRAKSTNQVAVIMDVLNGLGVPVPSLAKNDVKAALARSMPPAAKSILLCRQEAAKASTAKLGAMRHGACADGRCRGLFQFGGAGRTLRWAGRRVQPQNYPRGTVKGLASIFALLEQATLSADELSVLLPSSVMDAVSSMLRGCLVASPGHVLVSGDLAQIEARVVAWLAGQADILAVFASGEDVYVYTANGIGSDNRQLGKVCVLGLGFGMAASTFVETAASYGITLTLAEAEAIVSAWRAANYKIVNLWWDVDAAFKEVARGPHGSSAQVGLIGFLKTKKAVRIVLPSGREMTYHNVEVDTDEFGRDSISYMGVNPKTKKWERIRTYGGRLVENIVQAVARDVMAEAMLALSFARRIGRGHNGGPPMDVPVLIGTVHDELLGEAPAAPANAALQTMLTALRTTPAWAPGLPVDASGWTGTRYRK